MASGQNVVPAYFKGKSAVIAHQELTQVMMFITDLRPFNTLEGEGFKSVLRSADPFYRIISPKRAKSYADQLHQWVRHALAEFLKDRYLGLSFDKWKSKRKHYHELWSDTKFCFKLNTTTPRRNL